MPKNKQSNELSTTEKPPGINLKNIPDNIDELIVDKQCELQKQRKVKISREQCVYVLLKDAYLNGKKL